MRRPQRSPRPLGSVPLLRARGYVAAMESRPTCAVAARRGEGTGGRLWKAALRVLSPRGGARGCEDPKGLRDLWGLSFTSRAGVRGGYGKPPYVCCRREAGRGDGWAAMESRPTCAVAARRGEGVGGYGKPPYVCCRREAGRGGGRLWKAALRVLSPRGGARGTRRPQRSPRPLGSVLRFACGGTWRLGVADAPRLTAVRCPPSANG